MYSTGQTLAQSPSHTPSPEMILLLHMYSPHTYYSGHHNAMLGKIKLPVVHTNKQCLSMVGCFLRGPHGHPNSYLWKISLPPPPHWIIRTADFSISFLFLRGARVVAQLTRILPYCRGQFLQISVGSLVKPVTSVSRLKVLALLRRAILELTVHIKFHSF